MAVRGFKLCQTVAAYREVFQDYLRDVGHVDLFVSGNLDPGLVKFAQFELRSCERRAVAVCFLERDICVSVVDDCHLIGEAAILFLSRPVQRHFFRNRLLVCSDQCDRSRFTDGEPDISRERVVASQCCLFTQFVSPRRQRIVDLRDQTVRVCAQVLIAGHRVQVDRDHAADFNLFVKGEFHVLKRQ